MRTHCDALVRSEGHGRQGTVMGRPLPPAAAPGNSPLDEGPIGTNGGESRTPVSHAPSWARVVLKREKHSRRVSGEEGEARGSRHTLCSEPPSPRAASPAPRAPPCDRAVAPPGTGSASPPLRPDAGPSGWTRRASCDLCRLVWGRTLFSKHYL